MWLRSLPSRRRAVFFIARLTRPDLETLAGMLEAGQVRPVVERSYELTEIHDALRYVGDGHCRGKVVVTI